MASLACPRCGKHFTEYDVSCINCGLKITPEIRAKLLKELDDRIQMEAGLARKRMTNRPKSHKLERRLNRTTLGLFGTGWAKLAVPAIIVLLVIIVAALMFL